MVERRKILDCLGEPGAFYAYFVAFSSLVISAAHFLARLFIILLLAVGALSSIFLLIARFPETTVVFKTMLVFALSASFIFLDLIFYAVVFSLALFLFVHLRKFYLKQRSERRKHIISDIASEISSNLKKRNKRK